MIPGLQADNVLFMFRPAIVRWTCVGIRAANAIFTESDLRVSRRKFDVADAF
jgi:hypothetical protein